MKKMGLDLTEGPVLKVLLTFSIPILLTNILEVVYNIVDMAIVGRYLGSISLSAVSIGSDTVHVIQLACNGLCNAAQIVISQHMGRKDDRAVNKTIGMLFTLFGLISLALTVGMICFHAPVLRILNTPAEAWSETVTYSITCYFGILPMFGFGLVSSVLRGKGDSRHPLMFIAVSSVANLVLDVLLIIALDMGTMGAALATVISQTACFLWTLAYLYRNREQFGFDFKLASFKLKMAITKSYLKLAIPLFIQNVVIQLGGLYVNSYIYAYGVAVTSANGITTKLTTVGHVFSGAMIRGGAVMVGQNIAAGRTERVKMVVYINTASTAAVSAVLIALIVLFQSQVFGIFTTDPEVLALTSVFIPVIVLRYIAFVGRTPSMALINGIGKPTLNLIIGLLDSLVCRVGLSLLLGITFDMGLQGFLYGNAFGSYAPFFVGGIYFFSGRWKREELVTDKRAEKE